jgi:hypothetical protein
MQKKTLNQLIKNMFNKKLSFVLSLFFLLTPFIARAGILPPCSVNGNCGVCDMLYTVNSLMRVAAYISGVAALGFVIYGGILYVTSAGSKSQISKGTTVIKNAIFGTLVVLLAWVAVNFLIVVMTGTQNTYFASSNGGDGEITTVWGQRAWYDVCKSTIKGSDNDNDCEGKGDGFPCAKGGNYCLNGKCDGGEPACNFLNNYRGYKEFKCQLPSVCDISYAECDLSGNCFKNLCPNSEDDNGKIQVDVCCDSTIPGPGDVSK